MVPIGWCRQPQGEVQYSTVGTSTLGYDLTIVEILLLSCLDTYDGVSGTMFLD